MRYHKLFWHLRLVWTFCLLSSRSLSIARFHTAADEDYQTTLITQHSLVRDCIINTFELICSCDDKSKALLSVCCFLSISRLSSLAFFLRFSLFFLVPDSQYLIFHGEWGKVNPFFRSEISCLPFALTAHTQREILEGKSLFMNHFGNIFHFWAARSLFAWWKAEKKHFSLHFSLAQSTNFLLE